MGTIILINETSSPPPMDISCGRKRKIQVIAIKDRILNLLKFDKRTNFTPGCNNHSEISKIMLNIALKNILKKADS
jgi:hypothetical protein